MGFATRHKNVTADQFFAMTDRLPRGAQLIDGEVCVSAPTFRHQFVAGEIFLGIRIQAPPRLRGFTGWDANIQLDERNVYRPDVWWYAPGRVPEDIGRTCQPPDIAVEVLSESTRRYDLVKKRRRYEQGGVRELWYVEQDEALLPQVRVLRRSDEPERQPVFDIELVLGIDDEITMPLMPDLCILVTDVYAEARRAAGQSENTQ